MSRRNVETFVRRPNLPCGSGDQGPHHTVRVKFGFILERLDVCDATRDRIGRHATEDHGTYKLKHGRDTYRLFHRQGPGPNGCSECVSDVVRAGRPPKAKGSEGTNNDDPETHTTKHEKRFQKNDADSCETNSTTGSSSRGGETPRRHPSRRRIDWKIFGTVRPFYVIYELVALPKDPEGTREKEVN